MMIAESLAAALARYPQIVPVAVCTTAAEGERKADRADAVVMDQYVEGASLSAHRIRGRGVRVVFLGEGDDEDGPARVSPRSPVSVLASAVVPGAGFGRTRGLTKREHEVLELVGRGLAGKQVARHLGISPKTVEHHKTRIFAKLGVPNQAAAVGHAMADNLVRMGPWNRSII
jgi:DNA-binding CsgD family transcriptional regulator